MVPKTVRFWLSNDQGAWNSTASASKENEFENIHKWHVLRKGFRDIYGYTCIIRLIIITHSIQQASIKTRNRWWEKAFLMYLLRLHHLLHSYSHILLLTLWFIMIHTSSFLTGGHSYQSITHKCASPPSLIISHESPSISTTHWSSVPPTPSLTKLHHLHHSYSATNHPASALLTNFADEKNPNN